MRHAFSPDDADFISIDAALGRLGEHCTRNQNIILRRALEHYWEIRETRTDYPDAMHVAAQLKDMRADVPIMVSALFGSDVSSQTHSLELVREHFGQECAQLTAGVRKLNQLTMRPSEPGGRRGGSQDNAETLRSMVLSMVDDIRVVLVKLAFRTQRLYRLAKIDHPDREAVAHETLSIYAPLANRLGIGQLKWELEDVAFRIVEPVAYKRIAGSLEENRNARESYIVDFVKDLKSKLAAERLDSASVFGRPKHIYSIWKKMRSKHIEFSDLFDVRAVRVLVDDVQQCYGALGIVHSAWQPVTREFDDYIANPKGNGYRSLHTAVIGPAGKPVEVQIRTHEMDDHAENGVAAHWAYKEGRLVDEQLQKSIFALRQLLEDNDDEELIQGFSQQLDAKRVYAFTPKGEVIDLVTGATPLDFAYHIHSEIGHRCRGAKVNGSIVQLTYQLQNGDQVEVLTTREPGPSRDWLNNSLGYLNSGRARAKVRAWFNTQDQGQHLVDGRAMLDRELKRMKANTVSIEQLCKRLKFDKALDLYVSIGRNEITMVQVLGAIDHLTTTEPVKALVSVAPAPRRDDGRGGEIQVRGVGNLLTNIAVCCQPVPYDSIIGFITRGKGVSIHRADCSNMLNLRDDERERLIDVDWSDTAGTSRGETYQVEVLIRAYDRTGLLRDVSTVLASLSVDVVAANTSSDKGEQTAEMSLSLEVSNMGELAIVMDRVRQLRNVREVERIVH